MTGKHAVTDYPILDILAERWSPRAFSAHAVEPEKLRILLEAARWAPSCFGEEPWRFVLATKDDEEGFEKLAGCLSDGNAWAKNAPVLMLSVAEKYFARTGKPDRFGGHDVGLAMGNLCIQAQSMGIYVHQMGGYNAAKAAEVLGIPEDFQPLAMVAIGYLGDIATLPENLQQREAAPRHRKPQSEFVFGTAWGKPPKF